PPGGAALGASHRARGRHARAVPGAEGRRGAGGCRCSGICEGRRSMNILVIAIMVIFGIAALLCVVRIVLGPSILDRTVASDVLLTEVMCVLGADMAMNGHTRNI